MTPDTGTAAGEAPAGSSPGSGFAPLAIPLFRDRWIASTISSVGTWMQDTAGTWLMTVLTTSPLLIALMQTAASLPVLLLGRRSQVLARNGLLSAVLGAALEPGSSFARWLFLDPGARARIVNWPDFAAAAVGALRYETGRHPDDRQYPRRPPPPAGADQRPAAIQR